MSNRQLFISDLHLETARPDITRTLLQFLASNAGNCAELYILGDLFEAWIGDDDPSLLAAEIADALHQFSAAGAAIAIMHGNRDFLLGADFARRCNARLIPDPFVLQCPFGNILLLHGDTLCTDDHDYQQFRELVRGIHWQQDFLTRPVAERLAFAEQARQQSRSATAHKTMDIMDVNQQAVEDLLHCSGLHTMVHGHTHRPAVHQFSLKPAGVKATRVVLGSWEKQAWYAESDSKGVKLHKFPLLTNQPAH